MNPERFPRTEIREFWSRTLAQRAEDPVEAEVTPVAEPLPYRKYRVQLRGLGGVPIGGFLALPIQGDSLDRSWPAIITGPGYGGWQQGVMLSDCQRGYAVLQLWPRSQGLSEELWKIEGPDKLTWRLDAPDGAYYQGAYTDMMCGVDFLVSRPEIDAERVAAMGTSQGGGLALALAALDNRIKAVVAHLPFLCDVRRQADLPGSLVGSLLRQAGRLDATALDVLDFFDPLQMAPGLRAPALLSAGGRDAICPAEGIRAVYERIPGIKRLCEYPGLIHTSCTPFYQESWRWIERHLSDPL